MKSVKIVARLDSFFNPDGTFLPVLFLFNSRHFTIHGDTAFLFLLCFLELVKNFSRPKEISTKVLPDFSRAKCVLFFSLLAVSLILFASRKESYFSCSELH